MLLTPNRVEEDQPFSEAHPHKQDDRLTTHPDNAPRGTAWMFSCIATVLLNLSRLANVRKKE